MPRLADAPLVLASAALACVYAATTSGHMQSIDGLLMYRQGVSLAYAHDVQFMTSVLWGTPLTTSKYGIGLSLLYVPGLLIWSWLQPFTPVPSANAYDYRLLYEDPLYTVACTPVHILIVVLTAYLVARFLRALGYSRGIALWGLALFGLASPAFVYARDDFSQSLCALCWIGSIYAGVRYRQSKRRGYLLLCAVSLGYAVLTRPVEGSLLFAAVLVLLAPTRWRSSRALVRAYWPVTLAFAAATCMTLLVNWARFGSVMTTGYGGEGWTTSVWYGLVGSTISPAWGLVWQFPSILLVPLGVVSLWRDGARRVALALSGLILAQLLNTAAWHDWWGGWNWGLRLFFPAVPLCAVLAAGAIKALPIKAGVRVWLPALLFAGGLFWAIPCVLTDLLGGYAEMVSPDRLFALGDYPPLAAWAFLHHLRASTPLDTNAIDILWVRAAHSTGNASLIPPLLLLCGALLLARRTLRLLRKPECRLAGCRGVEVEGDRCL